MQKIDESKLESDIQYRYEYLAGFIGFGATDAAAIQAFAPHLGPRIPELVDKTYEKLLAYNATARHLVPPQHGYEGELPKDIADIGPDHPQVQFRKDHLNRYFMQLISRSYDAKMVVYLDMVGKIHTPAAGNKQIHIPLVQMNAFIGLISDLLIEAVFASTLDTAAACKTIRAFSKLLWIQNDLIQRHYAADRDA
jgi:hypothetical protein